MKTLRRRFLFAWLLALAIVAGPVAAHVHALSHLSDESAVSHGKHGEVPGSHARAACEGAYGNLGHALADTPEAVIALPAHAEFLQRVSVFQTGRYFLHYRGRAPPAFPG